MKHRLFNSKQDFQVQFSHKLRQILQCDDPGVYILVLANATTTPELFDALKPALKDRFSFFKKLLGNTSKQSSQFNPDDVSVFRQLIAIGFDNIVTTENKPVADWWLQFNLIRSLRPPRKSQHIVTQLHQPFDTHGFHFNKPFLSNETLWQGRLNGVKIKLLFNKFPFADYHGILVIEPGQSRPQSLQPENCDEIDRIVGHLSNIEGIGVAYNSIGAFASINHQHWQSFLSDKTYAVESKSWTHNGGDRKYPLTVHCYHKIQDAWSSIDQWQQQNIGFNLLLRPHRVYAVPRKLQGSFSHEQWSSGFAWSETMGSFTTSKIEAYHDLTASEMRNEMLKLSID